MVTPEQFKEAHKIVKQYEKQQAACSASRADYVGKIAYCWIDLGGSSNQFRFCKILTKKTKGKVSVEVFDGNEKFNGKELTGKIKGTYEIPFSDLMFSKNILAEFCAK